MKLVDQIPAGMVSTPHHIAVALGDPAAAPAVLNSLNRMELREASQKVVARSGKYKKIFCDFSSDEPLKQLAELQQRMSKRVILEDTFNSLDRIAGVDASYHNDEARAVCVVMDSNLKILDSASVLSSTCFPYIPGYLSFREAPIIEAAVNKISCFDVLIVNGHGIAHPRGCGLASHVGIDLDIPVVGVAKRPLVGNIENKRNKLSPILYNGRIIGSELRRERHSPIYISAGHCISLETSINIIMNMISVGSLPEPLRIAHIKAGKEYFE